MSYMGGRIEEISRGESNDVFIYEGGGFRWHRRRSAVRAARSRIDLYGPLCTICNIDENGTTNKSDLRGTKRYRNEVSRQSRGDEPRLYVDRDALEVVIVAYELVVGDVCQS